LNQLWKRAFLVWLPKRRVPAFIRLLQGGFFSGGGEFPTGADSAPATVVLTVDELIGAVFAAGFSVTMASTMALFPSFPVRVEGFEVGGIEESPPPYGGG
jgi:hypothetical protein